MLDHLERRDGWGEAGEGKSRRVMVGGKALRKKRAGGEGLIALIKGGEEGLGGRRSREGEGGAD